MQLKSFAGKVVARSEILLYASVRLMNDQIEGKLNCLTKTFHGSALVL